MKKIILLMALLAVAAVGFSSLADKTGKGRHSNGLNVRDEKKTSSRIVARNVKIGAEIVKIANYTSVDIEYREGDPGVEISGPDDMIDRLDVREQGVTLNFKLAQGVRNADFSKVKVKVSLPKLNEITLHGSGDFKADKVVYSVFNANILGSGDLFINNTEANSVKFLLRGSGDVKLGNVICVNIQFLTQGSGDITVNKLLSTSIQTILQGSGDMRLQNVESTQLELRAQGSGDIQASNIDVWSVNAVLQGTGDISIGGKAEAAAFTLQGTGDINASKLKCQRVNKSSNGTGEIYL